ncbi:MAG: hypothetical protein A2516_01080 [Alphaproteobacteria bacterium RIFOXYD12_FULL_60_8]|nr:MAG: hypothetical protein A2516_01080 [Alphaproteobacteria bacterium RIFOXYD12_FULL_60_8]
MFRSLGFKLVAASLAVELLMLAVLFANDRAVLSETFAQSIAQRQAELSHLMNAALAVPMVERDAGTLQDTLNAIYDTGGMKYLVLRDSGDTVMASAGWDGDVTPPPSSTLPGQDDAPVWHASTHVRLGGQVYGRLDYGLSTESLILARQEMQRLALRVFAAAMVASTLLFSAIGYGLTRRVRRVTRAAEAIARENPSARVPVSGNRDELDRLGRSFNAMAGALETKMRELADSERELRRSNDDLKQFAYLASHDLQTPLRNVVSYVQLLERRYGDTLGEDGREFVKFASDAAKKMSRLIRDLLAYSVIDAKPEEPPTPVALATVWDGVVAGLDVLIKEAGATVSRADSLPEVLGNSTMLAQVLENLLGNALKYRDSDRPPVIRLSAEPEGRMVCLSLSDNGIGIAPEYQERVFKIFQRLHPDDKYEGTGIGLSLCRKVVERHGGRIWATSDGEGKGTTFHFTLPTAGGGA